MAAANTAKGMRTPQALHNALQAAKARIAGAKRKRDDPEEDEEKEREDVLGQLKHVSRDGVGCLDRQRCKYSMGPSSTGAW